MFISRLQSEHQKLSLFLSLSFSLPHFTFVFALLQLLQGFILLYLLFYCAATVPSSKWSKRARRGFRTAQRTDTAAVCAFQSDSHQNWLIEAPFVSLYAVTLMYNHNKLYVSRAIVNRVTKCLTWEKNMHHNKKRKIKATHRQENNGNNVLSVLLWFYCCQSWFSKYI